MTLFPYTTLFRSQRLGGARLLQSQVSLLEAPFTEDEVRRAVWGCGLDKSPGPDGFGGGFFRHSWDIIRSDLLRMFSEFHRHGKLCSGLNSTFISLIPKVQNPQHVGEYRPIALIGGVYKVLANRLSKELDSVISESQSAFIGHRNILDGVLVASELIDEMKKKKKPVFLFKIDFEKAYDSVNWDFLLDMMEVMGFGQRWMK